MMLLLLRRCRFMAPNQRRPDSGHPAWPVAVILLLIQTFHVLSLAQQFPTEVVNVSSAADFYDAVDKSAPLIRVVDHFAIKAKRYIYWGVQLYLGTQNLSMAIWGECNVPVNDTIYERYNLPRNPGACAISFPGDQPSSFPETFILAEGHSRLWLSNLVIYSDDFSSKGLVGPAVKSLGGTVWLANVGLGGAWPRADSVDFYASPITTFGANAIIVDCAIYDTKSSKASGGGPAIFYLSTADIQSLQKNSKLKARHSTPQLLLVNRSSYTIDTISGTLGAVEIAIFDRSINVPTVVAVDNFAVNGAREAGSCAFEVCVSDSSKEADKEFNLTTIMGPTVDGVGGDTTGVGFARGSLDTLMTSNALPTEDDSSWLQTLSTLGVPGIERALSPTSLSVSPQPSTPTPAATPATGTQAPQDGGALSASNSPPPQGSAGAASRGSDSSRPTMAGAVGGTLAGLLLCAAFIALVMRRRRRKRAASALATPTHSGGWPNSFPAKMEHTSYVYAPGVLDSAHETLTGATPNSHIVGMATTVNADMTWALPSNTQVSCIPHHSTLEHPPRLGAGSTQSSTIGTNVCSVAGSSSRESSEPSVQRVQDASSIAVGLQFIRAQLADLVRAPGSVAFGEYTLLPLDKLRQGGQGVVHFASKGDKAYAIKFFASEHAFCNERELYANESLATVLPPVERICSNSDGRWRDRRGRLIAPFLIMEAGEALNDWVKRKAPDLITSMQVMCHLIAAVQDLHAVGLVHRDLKPSNTLWLPSRNGWTVMDYGSAALQGSTSFLSMTLAYAAPESIQAFRNHQRSVLVDRAVDVFALGVIAWELFTNSRVFPVSVRREEVVEVLLGKKQLPWEREGPESEAMLAKLGAMKEGVLGMLHREPRQRIALQDVYAQWTGLFTNTATPVAPQ